MNLFQTVFCSRKVIVCCYTADRSARAWYSAENALLVGYIFALRH